MKKVICVLLILMLLFSVCGCKSQKELPISTDGSEASQTSAQSTPQKIESQTESLPENSFEAYISSITQSPSQAASSTQGEVICTHSYRKETIGVSCDTSGYIKYTCSKCGDTYNGEAVPAGHDFAKYLCERCGKIDPACNVFWGMNAFLSTYGTVNGKGNLNCYPNDSAALCLSNYIDQKQFMISLDDDITGASISAYIDEDFSGFTYRKGSVHGSFETKNSAFSLDNKVIFDEFENTNPESTIDQDVFATECASMLRTLFNRIQNEILIPKTGLTFQNFGFKI